MSPGQIIELDWRRDLNKEKKEAEQQQRFLIDLRVSSFIIGLGGVLFLVHKYLMISNLDSIGIIAIGLGAINLLSLFFMNWLGWLEVDHFLKRLFIFTIELGGVLFIAHRYISIPYLDIAGIVILALGVVCLSFYIFAELAGI